LLLVQEKLLNRGGRGKSMDVPELIIKIARTMGLRFSLNGRPMTNEEVFSVTGLLPAISRRADQLSSLCLGYGIGVTFEEAEGSILGVKVVFDDITPNILRILCITDVLNELTQSTPKGDMAPLDQLMYD
jgi:intracellular multiplication protein IcmS